MVFPWFSIFPGPGIWAKAREIISYFHLVNTLFHLVLICLLWSDLLARAERYVGEIRPHKLQEKNGRLPIFEYVNPFIFLSTCSLNLFLDIINCVWTEPYRAIQNSIEPSSNGWMATHLVPILANIENKINESIN